MEIPEDMVVVGLFGQPHGIRGHVKLTSYCEVGNDIARYCPLLGVPGGRKINLTISGQAKGRLIVTVDGVDNRNDASALAGMQLWARRDRFPSTDADEYYHVDLIGLLARNGDGSMLGKVEEVANYGASDILVINTGTSETLMLPFTISHVTKVDLEGGFIVVETSPVVDREEASSEPEIENSEDHSPGL